MTTAIQENIKRHLQAKNMSAAELERRTGIPHAVVNILHGRSKNPSIKTAQAIAKELGCSVEELIAEESGMQSNPVQNQSQKQAWNAELYVAVFNAVYKQLQSMQLQPSPEQVGQWLIEVYNYALGSKTPTVDIRFVQWLLERG